MSKRVFEIAKEFNTETKVILEMLKKHQIKASNGFSSVGDEEYEKIKAEIGNKKAAKQPAKAAAQNYAVADGRKPEERQRSEKKQQERAAQKQREKEEQAAKAAQSAKAETKEKEAAPQEKTTAVPAAEAAAGGSAASATDAARQPERESAGSPRMETEEKPAAAKREYRSKNIEEKSQGGSRPNGHRHVHAPEKGGNQEESADTGQEQQKCRYMPLKQFIKIHSSSFPSEPSDTHASIANCSQPLTIILCTGASSRRPLSHIPP